MTAATVGNARLRIGMVTTELAIPTSNKKPFWLGTQAVWEDFSVVIM